MLQKSSNRICKLSCKVLRSKTNELLGKKRITLASMYSMAEIGSLLASDLDELHHSSLSKLTAIIFKST